MGREKRGKPRKPGKQTPRIVDMANVPEETKKGVILNHIMSGEEPMGRMVRELTQRRYGEFTVEERDVLDLPAQSRGAALGSLAKAAVRTAENCKQALARLLPLIQTPS
ncbi:hypothetical protein [Streptomyces collinus]|uniref:hypothetical protein n=1 Tax=Streptomyces collinus TaxID=42684 RepID=UPI00367A594A